YRSTSRAACVPFPAPGGPTRIMRMGRIQACAPRTRNAPAAPPDANGRERTRTDGRTNRRTDRSQPLYPAAMRAPRRSPAWFTGLSLAMAALLATCVALQHNDPDPLRWMLIYGAG